MFTRANREQKSHVGSIYQDSTLILWGEASRRWIIGL